MTVNFSEDKQRQKLEELREKEEEELAEMMSTKYGLPYIDLSVSPINIEALRVIKELEAREAEIAPFNLINKKMRIEKFASFWTFFLNAVKHTLENLFQLFVFGCFPKHFNHNFIKNERKGSHRVIFN